MSIYAKIGQTENPPISPHTFIGVLQEYMLGNMTAAEATSALSLTAAEQQQALDLKNKILTVTNNNAAVQYAMRCAKAQEIHNVLMLLAEGIAPLNTEALVTARLGV